MRTNVVRSWFYLTLWVICDSENNLIYAYEHAGEQTKFSSAKLLIMTP
jgi:hypothetical protein